MLENEALNNITLHFTRGKKSVLGMIFIFLFLLALKFGKFTL